MGVVIEIRRGELYTQPSLLSEKIFLFITFFDVMQIRDENMVHVSRIIIESEIRNYYFIGNW